jgi:ribonucleoside-triphosphate reductase
MEFKTEFGSFFKCRKCNEQDKVLRNFRPTEVYSRIVGYIRPLGQWNPGKKSEFKDRFTYDINK